MTALRTVKHPTFNIPFSNDILAYNKGAFIKTLAEFHYNYQDFSQNTDLVIGPLKVNNYFRYIETLMKFRNLDANWDLDNAEKINENAIATAIKIIELLKEIDLESDGNSIHIFPMRDGGVQFELDGSNLCSEIEVKPNGLVCYTKFNFEGEAQLEYEFENAEVINPVSFKKLIDG